MLELQKRNGLAGITPMGRDRRTTPRYSFTAEAEALDAHSRARMSARTSDISRGGCYVDTFCPFPKNSSVKIRMLRDNQALVADAKVVYSQLGMGMGLSFSAIDAENRQVLETWIGELSGTTPIVFKVISPAEPIAPPQVVKNDASYVVGELIIALMRRGALSPPEGNALLLKLLKPEGSP
jgi:hypothetical protein